MTEFTQRAHIVAEIHNAQGQWLVVATLVCDGEILDSRIVGRHAEHATAAMHLIAIAKTLEDPYDDRPVSFER
jgi:hypothetical protein